MKRKAATPPIPAAPKPARRSVLLVDDHPFMRAGLRQLIDRQPDLIVCGEAGNPAEAFQHLARGGHGDGKSNAHVAAGARINGGIDAQ